jgi:hypothetical protein
MQEDRGLIHHAVDQCIRGFAQSLVDKHGLEAPAQARRTAQRLEAVGDRQASAVWKWIHRAAVTVLKDQPGSTRSRH